MGGLTSVKGQTIFYEIERCTNDNKLVNECASESEIDKFIENTRVSLLAF